jgi:CBS domain-containing protein
MRQARDIMRTAVPAVGPGDSLARAAEIMGDFSVRELPVVEGGALVGILARSDLDPHVGQLEWTPVSIAMSASPRTIGPDASVSDVARALLDSNFNGIPVVMGDVLAGMVTRQDLLQLLVEP